MPKVFLKDLSEYGDTEVDAFITINREGILEFHPANGKSPYCITEDEANTLLDGREFNWRDWFGFSFKAQFLFDVFKKLPSEVLKFVQYSFNMGINPISHLQKLAGNKYNVHYHKIRNDFELSKFITNKAEDKWKPYVVVRHNIENGNIKLDVCHYLYNPDYNKGKN